MKLIHFLASNTPSAKPELWANLPRSLARKLSLSNLREPVAVTLADGDIRMEVDVRDAVGRTIYLYGCWEFPLTEFLRGYLKPHMCFLDVGANIGYFTLFAAKRCQLACGFEPAPNVFDRLARNIAINPELPCRIFNVAVADSVGRAVFYVDSDPTNHGLSSLIQAEGSTEVSVAKICLDAFVQQQGLARVHAIKVDVEGTEEAVFLGARNLIQRDFPDIIFESHPGNNAYRVLNDLGYEVQKLPSRWYEAPNSIAVRRRS